MLKLMKRHLNPATVIACIALFVALSGAAVAAKTASKNSVKTASIANGAVTTPKLKNGAVTTAKLRNGAVLGSKIAAATIGSGQLANGSVRSGQLGGQVVTEAKIKNGAVTETKLGAESVATGKIRKEAVTAATLSSSLYAQLVKNVTYVNKESGAVSATSPQSTTAECPAGKQAIGGGIRLVPGDATAVQITESIPFVAGDGKRTGWTATAKTDEATKTFAVAAYAICAEL
jgi:trimeric autotransporter adhesin